jgi:hypothetical protein
MRKAEGSVFLSLVAVVVLIVSVVRASAHGDDLDGRGATRQVTSVHAFPGLLDLEPAGDGYRSARLLRTDNGISWMMKTNSLTPGSVVTICCVIFDHPSACGNSDADEGARCAESDLSNPDVDLSVVWAPGTIVGGQGTAAWTGLLSTGELHTPHPAFDNEQGLDHPRGAEIHLIVHTHGPARPGVVHE